MKFSCCECKVVPLNLIVCNLFVVFGLKYFNKVKAKMSNELKSIIKNRHGKYVV